MEGIVGGFLILLLLAACCGLPVLLLGGASLLGRDKGKRPQATPTLTRKDAEEAEDRISQGNGHRHLSPQLRSKEDESPLERDSRP